MNYNALLFEQVRQDDIVLSRGKRCLNIPGFPNFCGMKPQKRPPPPPLKPYEYGTGYPTYSSGHESTVPTPVSSQFMYLNAPAKTSYNPRLKHENDK